MAVSKEVDSPGPASRAPVRRTLAALLHDRGVVVALLLITLWLSVATPKFFTVNNLINVLRQTAETAIGAAGQAVVILVAGIDLSVGSVLALAGVTAAVLATGVTVGPFILGFHWTLALALALALGAAIGWINGTMVTRARITPIITTLATMTAFRGIVYMWTDGIPIYRGLPQAFSAIGRGYLGPVPIPVLVMLCVYGLLWVVLRRTVAGRYIYAIGGNAEAARLSGVPVRRYTALAYVIGGICAALAGIVVLGRLNSAQPIAGQGFELDVITAVALGGVSLSGGKGSLPKVFVGSLIIAMLANGLVLMNVSPYTQMVVKGLVLAVAVGFDVLMARVKG